MATVAALRTSPVNHGGTISIVKADNDLVIAGYASVEMVDKQGDLITRGALKNAFGDFMKAEGYRNVQLAHSNIQVGSVIPHYTDSDGRVWKSGVDDAGMFVVIKLRDDIEKAREVANQIRKGALRGFSIGGQAFKRMRKSDQEHGDYTEISKLELHEVTICEKGINPEATFRILKEDTSMNDDNVLGELSSVLDRLNGRLDAMEKEDKDMPEGLKEHFKDKKNDKKDEGEKMADQDEKEAMYGGEHKGMHEQKGMHGDMAKGEYSDVITSEYLNWMENTLKSQGVDIGGARAHFDDISKANLGSTPEQIGDGADYFSGQVKGRAQEGGSPSTNAIGKLNSGGSGEVAKGYLHPNSVSASDLEAAYEVYKAAALEEQFKGNLGSVFADRLSKELSAEANAREAASFDARTPLANIEKALGDLSSRIDNISASAPAEGTDLRKSVSTVEIPSTQELGNMSWDDVHSLAGSVWNN
jgi:HK97 family phage prohead protease